MGWCVCAGHGRDCRSSTKRAPLARRLSCSDRDRESVMTVAAAVTAATMAAAVAAAEPAAAEVAEVDPDAEPSAVVERIVEPGVVPVGGVAVVAIAIAVARRDDDGGAGGGTAVVDVLAPVADVGLIQHGLDDRAGDLGVGEGD